MLGVTFTMNLATSIVAPMLPHELRTRKLLPEGPWGATLGGMLFSSAPIATLIATPLVPKITARIGRHTTCALGLLTFATAIATFGFAGPLIASLTGTPSLAAAVYPQTELCLLFLCRMIAAVGGSMAALGAMSCAIEANSQSRGMIVGASETALGLGFSVGPSVGAAFYTAGGFAAPFCAMAALACGLLPLLAIIVIGGSAQSAYIEPTKSKLAKLQTALAPWESPSAVAVCMLGGVSMFGLCALDPTLGPFEARLLHTSMAGIGVLFSAISFPYALLGTVVGAAVDAKPSVGAPLICIGVVGLGLALALLSPFASAPWMGTWGWQLAVLLVVGIATAAGMVPAVPQVKHILDAEAAAADRLTCTEDEMLAFVYSSFTLGEMLGPLAGSALVHSLGFHYATRTVGIAIMLAGMATAGILAASGHMCFRQVPTRSSSLSLDPLLDGGLVDDDDDHLPHGTAMIRCLSFEIATHTRHF